MPALRSLVACLHAVERAPSVGRRKPAHFIPIRFIFTNKLTKDDRLLLAFDAFVLSEALGREVGTTKSGEMRDPRGSCPPARQSSVPGHRSCPKCSVRSHFLHRARIGVSLGPAAHPERVRKLGDSEDAFAVEFLALFFAHARQQTEVVLLDSKPTLRDLRPGVLPLPLQWSEGQSCRVNDVTGRGVSHLRGNSTQFKKAVRYDFESLAIFGIVNKERLFRCRRS